MRKTIILILLGLVCSVGMCWADTEIFSASAITTSDVTISSGATDRAIASTEATISGGNLYAANGESSNKKMVLASAGPSGSKKAAFSMPNGGTKFKVVLSKALAAGDVISSDLFANSDKDGDEGLWFSTGTSRPSSAPATKAVKAYSSSWTSVSYTVTASDGICGETTFYIYRGTGTTTNFTDFTITRPTAYAITWNNGGHGTAPTSPTSASTFTLPTMATDGGYVNTGWTANVAVTYGGSSRAAGYVLPVGGSVTLSGVTTFTGVWKSPSSFALTSASEVEVAIAGTSTITYSGNAETVSFESADESIATVTSAGVITGVKGGKTTITVTDPGNESVAGAEATVTVLVPYANPSAADSYTLDNSQYGFSNTAGTTWYFKNGFKISNASNKTYSSVTMGSETGAKYSANTEYTISIPSNVTATYATIKARTNAAEGTKATWGVVFGINDYSSEELNYSGGSIKEKDFVIASPEAGGAKTFTPGGNQWQAIIVICTDTYVQKYTVTYMDGESELGLERVISGNKATASKISLAKSGQRFIGWYEDAGFSTPFDITTTTITADKTLYGKWQAGSGSVNIEQLVLDNGKSYNITGALTAAGIEYASLDQLDSLAPEKDKQNEAFLGLKYKKSDSYIRVYLKKGSTLRVKFGSVGANVNVVINSADPIVKTSSDLASPYEYTASTKDDTIKFGSTNTKTIVFKQIMIDEAIAVVRPYVVTISDAQHGSIESDLSMAKAGDEITLTPTSDSGYRLLSYSVTYLDKNNDSQTVAVANNKFTMPAYPVTVSATFIPTSVTATINATYGWATLSSEYPLDFTGTDVEAYIVTGVTGSVLDKTRVYKVPANTGLLITGTSDDIPTTTASADALVDFSEDKMKPGTGAEFVKAAGFDEYILSVENNKAVFKLIDADLPTVPKGKAFLQLASSSVTAPSIIRLEDEENNATNIYNLDASEKAVKFIENGALYILRDGVVYDALGRVIRK